MPSQFPVMYTNTCNTVEEILARLCYYGQKYTNTLFKKLEGMIASMPLNYIFLFRFNKKRSIYKYLKGKKCSRVINLAI